MCVQNLFLPHSTNFLFFCQPIKVQTSVLYSVRYNFYSPHHKNVICADTAHRTHRTALLTASITQYYHLYIQFGPLRGIIAHVSNNPPPPNTHTHPNSLRVCFTLRRSKRNAPEPTSTECRFPRYFHFCFKSIFYVDLFLQASLILHDAVFRLYNYIVIIPEVYPHDIVLE